MKKVLCVIGLGLWLWSDVYCGDAWNGEAYGKTMRSQMEDGESLIGMIEDPYVGECFILDVGSGDGGNTRKLGEKFPKSCITGIEPSESMIEKALENNGEHRIEYVRARIEDYREKEVFDCVTSIHVLHWVEDIGSGLKNIYEALKFGGRGYFVFAASKKGLAYEEALERVIEERYKVIFEDFLNTQHLYSLDDFENLLKGAGFRVDYIGKVLNQRVYEDAEFLKNWVAQWCPHRKYLEEGERERFMDLWLENYLGLGTKKEGGIEWDEYVIVVKVTKV